MRTDHYLLHILGVTAESREKFVDSKGLFLSPIPGSLILTVLRR